MVPVQAPTQRLLPGRRIVFVTRSSGVGGAEKHLADLIERFDSNVFEIIVLTMGIDPLAGSGKGANRPRARVITGPQIGRFGESWAIFRSLRPEVVVFVDNAFQAFHWQMYLAARMSGARRVVTIEHLIAPEAETRGLLRRKVTTRLPGLICHETLCVSDAVRDRLVQAYGYPTSRTITRRNGVDLKHFDREARSWARPAILSQAGTGPVIVCVAQLVPQKRIDLLVQAMTSVVRRHPETRCVVVGRGELEDQLRSMVKTSGMQDRVLFAGQTDDVRPYLAAGDIFVLPSDREGLPLALLEAMAFGLPCIAATAGGNGEVIQDGVNGFLVPRGSSDALADAMARLLGNRDERAQMGKNARRIAEQFFDIEEAMGRVKSAILGGV